jgi:hypothetical protein
MNQRSDRRLSELAWKVLYLPQRTHEVMSVTEAEDAYAHYKMPRWDNVVAAADNFDRLSAGSTIDHQLAETGDQWHVLAGTPSEQIIQTQFSHGDGNALKLIRHQGDFNAVQLTGYDRNVEAAEITTVTLKGDWMRQHSDDSTVFQLNFANANGPAVYVDPAGEYRIWQSDGTASGGIYLSSDVFAATNDWETIEIVLTFDAAVGDKLAGNYDVFLTRYAGDALTPLSRTQIADDIGIFSIDERTLMSLVISNQPNGYGDVVTYWDNVSFAVDGVFVPEPTVAAIMAIGMFSACSRRVRRFS